ncbi:MAG TPA: hypothetical protein VGK99_03970 [Acidobacteriota bacterium]|jgi:hypothetical protein
MARRILGDTDQFLEDADEARECTGWTKVRQEISSIIESPMTVRILGKERSLTLLLTRNRNLGIIKLANFAFPKFVLTSHKPALDEAVKELSTTRASRKKLEAAYKTLADVPKELSEQCHLAQSLTQVNLALRHLFSFALSRREAQSATRFLFKDYATHLFAAKAAETLRIPYWFLTANGIGTERKLSSNEIHSIIALLESKLFKSSLSDEAVKKQIVRWNRGLFKKFNPKRAVERFVADSR